MKKLNIFTKIVCAFFLITNDYLLKTNAEASMKLSSSAFSNQEFIPVKYTAQGEELSPPLKWQDVPAGTLSFALICEDPDAPHGTFDHWILYNIPPSRDGLPEGLTSLAEGMKSGVNSTGKEGYMGPNPPSGVHRYFFILYALDTLLTLPKKVTKAELLKAIENHILSKATLVGRYTREQ